MRRNRIIKQTIVLGYILIQFFFSSVPTTWGSDGDMVIAYSGLIDGFWQIWITDKDGDTHRQVTFSTQDKRFPIWLDADRIIYRTNDKRLHIYNIDTGKETGILAGIGQIQDAAWSKAKSLFVISRIRTDARDKSALFLTDMEGGQLQKLTRKPGFYFQPAWSPSGDKICFTSSKPSLNVDIFTINPDGGNLTRLTENDMDNNSPAYSPDGKSIAFVSNRSGDYEVWLMESDGDNSKQLTSHKGLDASPSWSPDGNRIVFSSHDQGYLSLKILDLKSNTVVPISRQKTNNKDPNWLKEL